MFEELIARIGDVLEKASIPYMIIGGQAVLLYGEPRLTRDIDITLGLNIDKLPQLLFAVNRMNLVPLPDNIEAFVRETYVLPTKEEKSGIRVDLIFSYTPYEEQAIARANKIKIKGIFVNFAQVEDAIIHKIFAGRPRDIEDVKSIILKNPDFDKGYTKKWLKEFDRTIGGKGFLKCFNQIRQES